MERQIRFGLSAAATLFVAAVSTAAPSSAQTSPGAIFEGQIVDSISGTPIEGVLVKMDIGAQSFTDERGRFRFTGLPQGRRLYALLSSDCRITWGQIDVVDGIPRRERLRLPPAFGAASEQEQRKQEERKRTGGRRVEAAEIEGMHVHSVTDLIRRVAPNMVGPLSGEVGTGSAIVSSRSRTMEGQAVPPVVVIDGIRVHDPRGTLHGLLASEVALLEVQPGASAGWEYGSSGSGGVIRITLKRGAATAAPERQAPAGCVVPDFPRG